jgi:hypothetical protein
MHHKFGAPKIEHDNLLPSNGTKDREFSWFSYCHATKDGFWPDFRLISLV